MSGLWDSFTIHDAALQSGNYELQLTDALLDGYSPPLPKSFYKAFLDEMLPVGPFDIKTWSWTDESVSAQYHHPNGWASTYRWVNPDEANGENYQKGMYSALDYMVFHNLYYLVFGNEISEPYQETFECYCQNDIQLQYPANPTVPETEAILWANIYLEYLPTCQPNVFQSTMNVENVVQSGEVFNINPKFPDYADLEITTAKFQTMDATVESGGTVNVNSKLIICNGNTLLVEQSGQLNSVKDDIRVKNGSTIDLHGDLIIEEGNEILIRSGGMLIMHPQSSLHISDNSRIIVEEGAGVIFYNGASITTDGEDAEFVLAGIIEMRNGGVFTLDHSNSLYSGRFVFAGPDALIVTQLQDQGFSEVHFTGKNSNDEIVVVEKGSRIYVGEHEPSNIDRLVVHSGKVVLKKNAYIETRKYFNTYDASYVSETVNDGIKVSAFNKFSACDFQNIPIKADLQFNESQKLIMISCNMTNEEGVNDNHDAMVDVDGIGLHVNNCTFLGSNDVILASKNLLYPSQVSNSTFNTNITSGIVSTIGVSDYSQTELKLIGNTFNKMFVATNKYDGDLTLRCNTFDNSSVYDVAGSNGCIVNISADDYGGYNYFNSASTVPNSSSIYLFYAYLNIANGKNYFNPAANFHIHGKLNYPCGINTDCSIDARNNQWENGLQPPAQNKFNVLGDDNLPFLVSANLTQLVPPCGSDDPSGPMAESSPGNSGTGQQQGQNNGNGLGPGNNNGNGNGNSPFSNVDNLPFISTSFNSNIRLDHAVAHGRHKMKPNNPNGDDEQAIDIFDEVFNNNIPKNSRQVKDWLNGAITDMKTSLENAVYEQRITGQLGQSGIEFYINEYLDALNFMTDSLIVDSNYTEAFYLELDKAHLYRMLQDPVSGFEVLKNTEICGLSFEEQKVLNYWKKEYELDIKVEQLGMAYLDTTIIIDTNLYNVPAVFNPTQYYFGTRFVTLNDRTNPDCNFGARILNSYENAEASVGLSIYPNPADNRVSIEFNEYENHESAELVFYSSDGRVTDAIKLSSENSITNYSVQSWLPGIYFYELLIGENKIGQGKLVVE